MATDGRRSFLQVFSQIDQELNEQAQSNPFPAYIDDIDTTLAPFCPTSAERVLTALRMANVGPTDGVLDLGSGDGRFVTAAVAEFNAAWALGIESDEQLVDTSRSLALQVLPSTDRIQFHHGDLLHLPALVNDPRWTVLVMFLLPDHTDKLEPLLKNHIARGGRVVSLVFNLDEIPDLHLLASDDHLGAVAFPIIMRRSMWPSRKQPRKMVLKTPMARGECLVDRLPREILLSIFSLLSFDDLVCVQMTCRLWKCIAQDASIWRPRIQTLHDLHPELAPGDKEVPWLARYCQAQTSASWKMGAVQHAQVIHTEQSRIMCIRFRDPLLVTLSEDNHVRLYEYHERGAFDVRSSWSFDTRHIAECIDVLPELNTVVIAFRGSKCVFYDILKQSNDPVQVLKGGDFPRFLPDSIALNQDYFALSGREPSSLFVWHWRRGVLLDSTATEDLPQRALLSNHHVFLVGEHGLVLAADLRLGFLNPSTFHIAMSDIGCIAYDNALRMVVANNHGQTVDCYQWKPVLPPKPSPSTSPELPTSSSHPSTLPRLGRIFPSFMTWARQKCEPTSPATVAPRRRSLRYSSYNDYGYACKTRTDRYLRHRIQSGLVIPWTHAETPDITQGGPDMQHRLPIRSPIAEFISSVALYHDMVVTVKHDGDMDIFTLNGPTRARVVSSRHRFRNWMTSKPPLSTADLSDPWAHLEDERKRSRIAMGKMGILYGNSKGELWWLDFRTRCRLP